MIADLVKGFCTLVDRETLLHEIMPSVEDLVSDSSQHVRAALGSQISGLAPILGKQEYVLQSPTLSNFLILILFIVIQDGPPPSTNVSSDAQGRLS